MATIQSFASSLARQGLAASTIRAYVYAAQQFRSRHKSVTEQSLLCHKGWLTETYGRATANLRIIGLNAYLIHIGKGHLRLKGIKAQHRQYLDHVISDSQYRRLKRWLAEQGNQRTYFAVWTMAATGARVSELLCLRACHYRQGYADIIGKGGKARRLYIPARLCREAVAWLGNRDGWAFTNQWGGVISARSIARDIQQAAKTCGIDPRLTHPHAFRHRFALNFLAKHKDIALLADLLGHASIDTTRIYLRKTSVEQSRLINRIVDW